MTDSAGPFDIAPERAFIKHKVYGDIYAIEHATIEGKRTPLAARKCSRPEEMTSGALPVLTLHSSGDALEFVTKNYLDFTLWEAPKVREELVQAVIDATKERDVLAADYNKIRKEERAALKKVEAADEKIRVAARALNAPPAEPAPLIALAEGSNSAASEPIDQQQIAGDLSPEEFEAAMGSATPPGLGDVPDPQSPDFYAGLNGDTSEPLPEDTDDDDTPSLGAV